jgi:hypothetical protein
MDLNSEGVKRPWRPLIKMDEVAPESRLTVTVTSAAGAVARLTLQ